MGDLNITPGPWEWDDRGNTLEADHGDILSAEVKEINGFLLGPGDAYLDGHWDESQDQANRKAIAAVPEYEAHRRAQNSLRAAIERRNGNPFDEQLNEAVQRAADAADAALDALNAALEVNGGV